MESTERVARGGVERDKERGWEGSAMVMGAHEVQELIGCTREARYGE